MAPSFLFLIKYVPLNGSEHESSLKGLDNSSGSIKMNLYLACSSLKRYMYTCIYYLKKQCMIEQLMITLLNVNNQELKSKNHCA